MLWLEKCEPLPLCFPEASAVIGTFHTGHNATAEFIVCLRDLADKVVQVEDQQVGGHTNYDHGVYESFNGKDFIVDRP